MQLDVVCPVFLLHEAKQRPKSCGDINMKKPTGIIGNDHVYIDEHGVAHGNFERVSFPGTKEEIEKFIATRFMEADAKAFIKENLNPFFSNLRINKQDDLDFLVSTPYGDAFLELMEVAPLAFYKTTHEEAPKGYDPLQRSAFIHEEIIKKSEKYRGHLPIVLLLYNTNYKFRLDDNTKHLVSYYCYKSRPKFARIFSLTPAHPPFEDVLSTLYPREDIDFRDFNPEDYGGWVMHLS